MRPVSWPEALPGRAACRTGHSGTTSSVLLAAACPSWLPLYRENASSPQAWTLSAVLAWGRRPVPCRLRYGHANRIGRRPTTEVEPAPTRSVGRGIPKSQYCLRLIICTHSLDENDRPREAQGSHSRLTNAILSRADEPGEPHTSSDVPRNVMIPPARNETPASRRRSPEHHRPLRRPVRL